MCVWSFTYDRTIEQSGGINNGENVAIPLIKAYLLVWQLKIICSKSENKPIVCSW